MLIAGIVVSLCHFGGTQPEFLEGCVEPSHKNPLDVIAIAFDRAITATFADQMGGSISLPRLPQCDLASASPGVTAATVLASAASHFSDFAKRGVSKVHPRYLGCDDMQEIFVNKA